MSIQYFVIYFLAINYISALACIYDKHQAKIRKRRVSEASLFMLSFAGGAISMYVAMRFIRHKTKKKRFMVGLPIIIFCHIVLVSIYMLKNFIL